MDTIEIKNTILSQYSIDNYINLFKLIDKERKFLINIILNDKLKSKLRDLINDIDSNTLNLGQKYNVSIYTVKRWLNLERVVPLSFVFDVLVQWHHNNKSGKEKIILDVKFFLENFEKFNCRGSFETKLPKKFSPDLFYLVGLILGDGSLAIKFNGDGDRQYEVYIEKVNYKFLRNEVYTLFKKFFQIENIKIIQQLHNINQIRYRVFFKSRIVYEFLIKVFDIPPGKKSHIITFPSVLNELSLKEKIALFAGLVDTDWGRIRWNRFGTHMSSKGLATDYKNLFDLLEIDLNIKRYVQKEKFVSYQCFMNKGEEYKLFNILNKYYPLKNPKRIKTITARMTER